MFHHHLSRPVLRSLLMGILCCPVGVAVGIYISWNAVGKGWQLFYVHAGMATFLTSTALWRLLIERKNARSVGRGIVAGALSGCLAHYVCWYLQLLVIYFSYWFWVVPGLPLVSLQLTLCTGCGDMGFQPVELVAIWLDHSPVR